jgi:hypothetical protein
MAKPRPRRSSSSHVLRLQRLAMLNQIVGLLSVLLPMARVYDPSTSNWRQPAGGLKISVAKAPEVERICASSKRGRLQPAGRPPKRKKLPAPNRLGPSPVLSCTGRQKGVSANDR